MGISGTPSREFGGHQGGQRLPRSLSWTPAHGSGKTGWTGGLTSRGQVRQEVRAAGPRLGDEGSKPRGRDCPLWGWHMCHSPGQRKSGGRLSVARVGEGQSQGHREPTSVREVRAVDDVGWAVDQAAVAV